ncbi:sodium/glutamate symporter [Synechococcus sp. PCC 7336]|uniref:sodium/glutamate symporter n=1 Tax=Synechococcus sp. PCC 7336 TaxID=195250 RepID=UPI0003496108|nr:sodium/glutamate symporter [Synechococcus sp. PCC 7336]
MVALSNTVYTANAIDMLSISISVLFLGMFINRKVQFLRDNYIPPAVTGGLLFSILAMFLYSRLGIEINFDLRFRDLLLLVFFSTVGLSARIRTLLAGGKALASLIVVAAVFLFVQDVTGIGLALLTGQHPGYGLMGGSVSFAGGHGTAIAWGMEAEAAGLTDASAVGIAFATFGLICGGLLGGPIARQLMKRIDREHSSEDKTVAGPKLETDAARDVASPSDWLFEVLKALLLLALCVSLGDAVNRFLFAEGVLLPGFLTSMFVAIAIANLFDLMGIPLDKELIDRFGEVSLNIFLSMSLMSLQLWTLASGAQLIVLLLFLQVLLISYFAAIVVFRVMGQDYDAVVVSAGFVGLGLGATPIAIANMDAVTRRYGPSPKAFLVIPLLGACFIDLLNAATIKFFIAVIARWFL